MESGGQNLALGAPKIVGNTMDLNATIIDDSETGTGIPEREPALSSLCYVFGTDTHRVAGCQ